MQNWSTYKAVREACAPEGITVADDGTVLYREGNRTARAKETRLASVGVFWLDKGEFFTYFDTVYVCAHDMTKFLKGHKCTIEVAIR